MDATVDRLCCHDGDELCQKVAAVADETQPDGTARYVVALTACRILLAELVSQGNVVMTFDDCGDYDY